MPRLSYSRHMWRLYSGSMRRLSYNRHMWRLYGGSAMHIIIFANGDLTTSPLPLPAHDLLIGADGGARNAFRYGLVPDVVIGDFDSLGPDEIAGFDRAGASLYRFPADKDETDLELALDFSVQQRAAEITLYGLFGGRWDMTFANLLLLASEKYAGVRLTVVAGAERMHILRGGDTLAIHGSPGDLVSVLPLSGTAEGITYEGLAWPLDAATLPFGSPRGVSNAMVAHTAKISIRAGIILIVVIPSASKGQPGGPPD